MNSYTQDSSRIEGVGSSSCTKMFIFLIDLILAFQDHSEELPVQKWRKQFCIDFINLIRS